MVDDVSWRRWLTEGVGAIVERGKMGEESEPLARLLASDVGNVA